MRFFGSSLVRLAIPAVTLRLTTLAQIYGKTRAFDVIVVMGPHTTIMELYDIRSINIGLIFAAIGVLANVFSVRIVQQRISNLEATTTTMPGTTYTQHPLTLPSVRPILRRNMCSKIPQTTN